MKKKHILLIILFLLIGIPTLNFLIKHYTTKQEMLRVVKKTNVKNFIEKSIRETDPNAFTDAGIIKSYEIDYNSLKSKSSVEFTVTVIINNDEDQFMWFVIETKPHTKVYLIRTSHKLREMLLFEE